MAKEYAEIIRDELQQEQDTAAQFYQRAMGIVTTSSALVTVFGGLLAIAGLKTDFQITGAGIAVLILAAAAFLIAITLALYEINAPLAIVAADTAGLQKLIDEEWSTSSFEASRTVAQLRVQELRSLRQYNHSKATYLLVAYVLVALAVLLLALSVALTVA